LVASRVAAIWRHVLTDPRNYGRDPNTYVDTSVFSFYLAFGPGEHITANIEGWGPKTEQIVVVNNALGDYAFGKMSEEKLLSILAKAENKLGI
jgi:hypothetical protein